MTLYYLIGIPVFFILFVFIANKEFDLFWEDVMICFLASLIPVVRELFFAYIVLTHVYNRWSWNKKRNFC